MSEHVRHNCGFVVTNSLENTYLLLKSLQNRGKEAAGLALVGPEGIDVIKWEGRVESFDIEDLYKIFPGPHHMVMGHVRYATRGRKDRILEDAHPHTIGGEVLLRGNHIIVRDAKMAVVHNGQVSDHYLKDVDKSKLHTECDTEAILHKLQQMSEEQFMHAVPGTFTLAFAQKGRPEVVIMRDRYGIKPGVLGWRDAKWIAASENAGFGKRAVKTKRDISPGSIVYISPNGSIRETQVLPPQFQPCFFEYNYIADLESVLDNVSVQILRQELGKELAREHPLSGFDFVAYVPRCPEVAADSYAHELSLPLEFIFYKTKSDRSFQGSDPQARHASIESNLHLCPEAIELIAGKKVAVIDDSIVRGNVAERVRHLLYEEGKVAEARLLSYTPPIGIIGADDVARHCPNGVDMPLHDNFVARGPQGNRSLEEISKRAGMQVHYLSTAGMMRVFRRAGLEQLCTYCIGGPAPFDV